MEDVLLSQQDSLLGGCSRLGFSVSFTVFAGSSKQGLLGIVIGLGSCRLIIRNIGLRMVR